MGSAPPLRLPCGCLTSPLKRRTWTTPSLSPSGKPTPPHANGRGAWPPSAFLVDVRPLLLRGSVGHLSLLLRVDSRPCHLRSDEGHCLPPPPDWMSDLCLPTFPLPAFLPPSFSLQCWTGTLSQVHKYSAQCMMWCGYYKFSIHHGQRKNSSLLLHEASCRRE